MKSVPIFSHMLELILDTLHEKMRGFSILISLADDYIFNAITGHFVFSHVKIIREITFFLTLLP